MNEELITFETAKLAKEKGFNWNTIHYFEEELITNVVREYQSETGQPGYADPYDWNLPDEYNPDYTNWSRPTQSLLQKWLREVHNIYIWVSPIAVNDYKYTILSGIFLKWEGEKFGLDTYESALEIALQKGLTLIK
jgi:hypothetical protein